MLDNGFGFNLVPWRPVIEQKVGRQLSAVVRGDYVSWKLGRWTESLCTNPCTNPGV